MKIQIFQKYEGSVICISKNIMKFQNSEAFIRL